VQKRHHRRDHEAAVASEQQHDATGETHHIVTAPARAAE